MQARKALLSLRGAGGCDRGTYIGHTIVARALAVGLEEAVPEMRVLIQNPRRDPLFGSVTP
jgi:hypothetical protein